MFTRDDLIDLIVGHLKSQQKAAGSAAPSSEKGASGDGSLGPRGRLFLSEHEIKKRLTAGEARLTIPKDAILSPLAVDWLVLRGIKIVRE